MRKEDRTGSTSPPGATSTAARILRNASDLVVIVSGDDIVEEVFVNGSTRSLGPLDHWKGGTMTDFLTVESVPKFRQRLSNLRRADNDAVETLEINHLDAKGREFPIRYTVQRDDEGRAILLGRDLRAVAEVQQQLVKAQLALEREYEKHRDFETRYRVLRDNVDQALFFLDPATGRISDANRVAAKLLGVGPDAISGMSVGSIISAEGESPVVDLLMKAAADPIGDPLEARAIRSENAIAIRPLMFRSAGETMILCRAEPLHRGEISTESLIASLESLFERTRDAIVFTDSSGGIVDANEGFLSLCDVVRQSDLKGKTLADYLLRGAIDERILLENAASQGGMRTYATRLRSANGAEIPVEIATTYLGTKSRTVFGFVIRERSRDGSGMDVADRDDAMRNAMELVGTAPLKELVAATADVVEKMCIETAIELTDNNRVAAAELLGLSRQSFYVRLRKYGMLKKDED